MIWKPDSCFCILQFNGENTKKNFVKFIKKCKLHDKVEQVIKHNQDLNLKYGSETEDTKDFKKHQEEIRQLKSKTKNKS
tara:strand:- start:651 stop:887 length:237 start_codon:yes stop_codon:yes gene_type:complete